MKNLTLEHHSSFAHTLNLIVKDGLAKAEQLGSVIKKCSKLVSFVRKSTVATNVLKEQKKTPGKQCNPMELTVEND